MSTYHPGPMQDLRDPTDLASLAAVAAAVESVQDAAAVVDLQLRAVANPADDSGAGEVVAGHPVPGERLAEVCGPEPTVRPAAARTLTEALQQAADLRPEAGTTYVLPDGGTDRQTYAELLNDARRVLCGLRDRGLRPGDPVLLHLADNRSFVTTWWACVLGGMLPTPVATAREYTANNAAVRKLHAAWDLLEHPLIVTDATLVDAVTASGAEKQPMRVVAARALIADTPADPYPATPDTPALNLLTSGSTGTPKCVHHAHRTIIARSHAMIAANAFTEHEVSLNWMPLDHVGGMVMSNVRDVVLRCEHVNVPTETVVRRPLAWLDLADQFGATATWAPNFAFAMVAKHEEEIAASSWNLSRLRNVCNAGEAVVPRTALRFLELLAPHGLPADAMVPCWGMSETSSGVTYSRMRRGDPTVGMIAVDPASLEDQVVESSAGACGAVKIAEVGAPIAGVRLRIVSEDGTVLPEGRVGRLHVGGTTVMRGYLNNPEANKALTADGWFDTGDLGFLKDGRLYLTGRKKHMVIVNGANYPAHEVETVVEQVPGVQPACTAVCAVRDDTEGTDAIAIFFVPTPDAAADLDALLGEIRGRLATDLALRPQWLVPLTEDEFPRAPGGKVQRERLLEGLASGKFSNRLHEESAPRQKDGDFLLEPIWTSYRDLPPGEVNGSLIVIRPAAAQPSPDPSVGVLVPGPAFRVLTDRYVEADPLDPDQQDHALAYLANNLGGAPDIVHAAGVGASECEDLPVQLAVQLAAIARTLPGADVTVLTSSAAAVTPHEDVRPERAALTALVRTAITEDLLHTVRFLDHPDAESLDPRRLPRTSSDLTAVRDGVGYVPRLRVLSDSAQYGIPSSVLPQGGTVLLVGGLGGLGRIIAEQFIIAAGARLLVTGRTPEEKLVETGKDKVLDDLRSLGHVSYAAVDVTDSSALAAAVEHAEKSWGQRLDLIVHVAGEAVAPQWERVSAHDLARETAPWFRRMLAPKLGGAAAIDRLLASRPNAAVLLYSSVNGFLGGSSFGAYAAANAGLEGWARRWVARGRVVRCVAWSMWAGPGMNDGSPFVTAAAQRGLRLIQPHEGLGLLLRVMNTSAPVVLAGINRANPHMKAHLSLDQFSGGSTVVAVVPRPGADPEQTRHEVGAALAAHGAFARVVVMPTLPRDQSGAVDTVAVLGAGDQRTARYIPPEGETEELVARIVGNLLNVARVGRDDSFFSLGSDSIRAVQLAAAIGEALGYTLSVDTLYKNPTVRDLVNAIGD